MGRIRELFGIEGDALKVTSEMTVDALSMAIFKLKQSAKVTTTTTTTDSSSAEAEDQGSPKDEAVLHSKADLITAMASEFEEGSKDRTPPGSFLTRWIRPQKQGKLLFGATGIIGSHLLRYMLKAGAPRVYCVVRAANPEGAYHRIEQKLKRLRLWSADFETRIVAMPGDISHQHFGLQSAQYKMLLGDVGDVILAAGSRSWVGEADQIAANITGTMDAVAFAREGDAAVHYISTSWLDIYDMADDKDKEGLSLMPYFSIKRKGEEILQFAARHHNVICSSYRLPLVSVSSKGAFEGDLFLFYSMQVRRYMSPDWAV